MYHIIEICRFYKSLANCDERSNYKGDQLHRFYCRNTKFYVNLHFSNVVASTVAAMADIANSRNIFFFFHVNVTQVRVPLICRCNGAQSSGTKTVERTSEWTYLKSSRNSLKY